MSFVHCLSLCFEACGGTLVAGYSKRIISSPGYPDGYGPNLNCTWQLRSTPGHRLWFNITDIDLEPHSSCRFDFVNVNTGKHLETNV